MHVLVSVASKHGATAEMGEAIGRELNRRGITVDVIAPDAVTTVDGYDAVVLGSAIYAGHWMKPAVELVERFGPAWSGRPVWLFSSGPLGDPLKPDDEHAVDASKLIEATAARDHRLFAGKLDRHALSFGEKAIVMAVRSSDGDFRDWFALDAWATHIADSLQSGASPSQAA